jgi:GNAT superfamily N-acetyltransferase
MADSRIRPITADDVAAVVALVHELAAYERAADECALTTEQLSAALFGAAPALFGYVAVVEDTVVGCALWFLNFSTWRGVHGIYLEDLYVQPKYRGQGLGRALLVTLAAECERHGYARLEWAVLNWNAPALGFYRSLGALPPEDWTMMRLTGAALQALASS